MQQQTIRVFRENLRKLERIIEAQLQHDTCCHGVSVAQCHALLATEGLGTPSLGELAAYMGLDKSTLSRTVEGLVKAGLLLRTVDEADRRAVRIGLTGEGQMVCDGINRANDARYGRILEVSGRDPAELVQAFADLVAAMGTVGAEKHGCKYNTGGV